MSVSIQDVAKRAGVTIGTVSRAFNNYTDIKEETKQRIMKAADELGYIPNVSARNLSAKRPPNIGLIVSGLLEGEAKDNLLFLLLQGIMEYTTRNKLELALYTTDSAEQRKQSFTDFCAMHSISGAIVSGIRTDDAYFDEFLQSGIPMVTIDLAVETKNASWVSIANRVAAKDAVLYLFSQGHRDLLIVNGRRNADVNTVRLKGVRDAYEEAGMMLTDDRCLYCNFSEKVAHDRVADYLAHAEKLPDAIFCFSDVMAIGVMDAIREAGLSIPQDISLMGFDGLIVGELTTPKLTTVTQDMRAMGYAAAEELHELMELRHEGVHKILPHRLTIRESVAGRNGTD